MLDILREIGGSAVNRCEQAYQYHRQSYRAQAAARARADLAGRAVNEREKGSPSL